MQYNAIDRATALPVPDSRLGEKMCLARLMTLSRSAGTRVSGKEILDQALGLPHYDVPEYFLALSKDGADEIVDLSRQDFADGLRKQVYAAEHHRCRHHSGCAWDTSMLRFFTRWSYLLVVIGFEAGRTPVMKTNYLLLKNIEAQRTAGERLQDRSARADREIFSRRSFHSMSRVRSNQRRRSPVCWRSSGDAFP